MTNTNPNNYIPRDYEDLYRHYILGDGHGNSLTDRLIRKFLRHATPDEKETLRHDVFLRLIEFKMIEKFDPAKANFGGAIYFTVRTVCGNHLSHKAKNPLTGLHGGTIVESDPSEEGEFELGTYSLDRVFATEEDTDAAIDARNLLGLLTNAVRARFERKRNKRDESLLPLLEMLELGYSHQECAKKLGVQTSTISNWQAELRAMAEEIKATWLTVRKRSSQPRKPLPTEELA